MLLARSSQDSDDSLTLVHFAGRPAGFLQLLFEIDHLNRVLYPKIRDGYLHRIQPFGDAADPLIAADRCQPLSDSLVQRLLRDIDRVPDAEQLAYLDAQ